LPPRARRTRPLIWPTSKGHAMPQTAAMLDVDRLHPAPGNRPDGSGDDELPGLAATIRALGVLHAVLVAPIEGEDGEYLIQDGHRRWRAAQMAGLRQVPALIRRSPARAGRVEGPLIAVVTSFQRVSLGPVELAEKLGDLLGEGMTQADIARYTGMSPATISYHVQLLQADEQTLDAVRRGELTVGSVHEHIRSARGAGPGRSPATRGAGAGAPAGRARGRTSTPATRWLKKRTGSAGPPGTRPPPFTSTRRSPAARAGHRQSGTKPSTAAAARASRRLR
jgi:ParB family transcriptional regulator, chromosome partitioning protein